MHVTSTLRQATAIRLRFQPGATGRAGTITVGTVTTGAPGSDVEVTNTGTREDAILDFTIPEGEQGEPNTLTIGTVTTLPYGEDATAEITGDAPNQTLDLGLPMGIQGPSGSVTDGDKGDIVVSAAGTIWEIEDGAVDTDELADASVTNEKIAAKAVDFPKMQDIGANEILGRTTSGAGAVERLTPAQVRTLTGQGRITVFDQTVSGSASYGFIVPIGSFKKLWGSLLIKPNSSMADFFVIWRTSTNGGATFDDGVSDYQSGYLYQSGSTVVGGGATLGSFGQLSSTIAAASTSQVAQLAFEFDCNQGGVHHMRSATAEFNGTAFAQAFFNSQRQDGTPVTHILIATDVATAFAPSSSLFVEGH